MNTALFAITIPTFIESYGKDKQWDVVFTIDHDRFHNKYKDDKALANGLSIDSKGNMICSLNFVSYMKVAKDSSLNYEPGTVAHKKNVA